MALLVGPDENGNVVTPSPAQIRAAAADVEVTIGEVRHLVQKALPDLEGRVDDQVKVFRSGGRNRGLIFGAAPEALDFSAQLDAAHEVFVETVHAILRDLTDFRDRLQASLDRNVTTDENNAESFMRLFSRSEVRQHYSMGDAQTHAVRTHEYALDQHGAGAGAPGVAPAAPAASGDARQARQTFESS